MKLIFGSEEERLLIWKIYESHYCLQTPRNTDRWVLSNHPQCNQYLVTSFPEHQDSIQPGRAISSPVCGRILWMFLALPLCICNSFPSIVLVLTVSASSGNWLEMWSHLYPRPIDHSAEQEAQ